MLTVEDVNSVNSEPINEFYRLNTADIGTDEFTNVLYDFIVCNHNIGIDSYHTFTFQIVNTLWNGGYAVCDANNMTLEPDVRYDSSTKTITIVTTESSINLYLILCSYDSNVNFMICRTVPSSPVLMIAKNEVGTRKIVHFKDLYGDNSGTSSIIANLGVISFDYAARKVWVVLKKTDLVFDLSDTVLTVGQINKVCLGVDSHYLPDGDLVDNEELPIEVIYDDTVIPVTYDETIGDYCFDLDLTNKLTDNDVKLTVKVYESEYVNATDTEVVLNSSYVTVDSFTGLNSAITMGASIIRLTDDITFESDLNIPDTLYLIGDGHNVFLNYHSIIVNNSVKLENTVFNYGNPAIIQHTESNVNITGCSFIECVISDNYKGSILSSTGESLAKIINTNIVNCFHSIYYNGDLTLENVTARYNTLNDYVDTDYSCLLSLYEGSVSITECVFDIDIISTKFCTRQTNAKFLQSLISLGTDTVINGVNSRILTTNDCLPLFESPYNNRAHLYIQYYYPQVESCVISSPIIGKEDKNCCHNIIGSDWVYKNNTQVTRTSWGSENNNRVI